MRAASDPGHSTQEHLERLLCGDGRARLCATVANISRAPLPVIDDAVQEVSQRALAGKCSGTSEGEVFRWLVTATLRRVAKLIERAHARREVPVDWHRWDDPREPSEAAEVEVLARERERELEELARTVVAALDERERRAMALHSRSRSRQEIAQLLGITERQAKRLREEGYEHARRVLVEAAGGGCSRGERLISRLSFGLASPGERSSAQLHLAGCERCTTLYQRLELVHEKVAALLPIPATAQADPGLVEQAAHKAADALAQSKQQLAALLGHARQHAAAGYGRVAEYAPLAGTHPGAAATAVAGCLAVGGGAAGYCLNQGVNPLSGLAGVIPHQTEHHPHKRSARPKPRLAPAASADPVARSTPTTPVQTQPETPTKPASQQREARPTATPAAVQFGEPSSPPTGSSGSPTSSGTSQASTQPSKPASVPSGGVDLYGP